MRFLYGYKLIRLASFLFKEIFSRPFIVNSGVSLYSHFLGPKRAKTRVFGGAEYSVGSVVLFITRVLQCIISVC